MTTLEQIRKKRDVPLLNTAYMAELATVKQINNRWIQKKEGRMDIMFNESADILADLITLKAK